MVTGPAEFMLTKIIATIGPASESSDTMARMIEEGMRVVRVNFSHGTLEGHARVLERVREESDRAGLHIGVIGDLPGPKIRIDTVVEGGIELTTGVIAEFHKQARVAGLATSPPEPVRFSTNTPEFIDDVQVGDRILIDDGNIQLVCEERKGSGETAYLVCHVCQGGTVTSRKGINLPDTSLAFPSLTEQDLRCVDFAVEKEFDFLALSFVRSADDVRALKSRLGELGARSAKLSRESDGSNQYSSSASGVRAFIPVIAKIEKPQALDDLDNIIDEADVIMVARGDLGVEMDLAQVPVIQKRVVERCHDYGKPVVVATQMLQSMIEAPTPTRAEVSDVANAIFEGADAVMLSGETAVGIWPVETVRMMRRIATRAHERLEARPVQLDPPRKPRESRYRTAALAHGVGVIVRDLDARLVVMWSQTGGGASYLSQNRLPRPIVAFSSRPTALRRMSVMYGVKPVLVDLPADTETFVRDVDELLLKNGWAEKDDAIVIVLGEPIGVPGLTNKLRIHYVGDEQ